METRDDVEEIADNLSEKQREILLVFADSEQRNTREITHATGHPNQTVGHHINQTLAQHGLLEKDGKDHSTSLPRAPIQYRLTDHGAAVIDVYRQRQAQTEADISRVDALEQTVERVEKENARLRERHEELEERFDQLKDYLITQDI